MANANIVPSFNGRKAFRTKAERLAELRRLDDSIEALRTSKTLDSLPDWYPVASLTRDIALRCLLKYRQRLSRSL